MFVIRTSARQSLGAKSWPCRFLVMSRTDRSYATTTAPIGLKVNESRLWSGIHHTCQWGTGKRWGEAAHETGMSRLALTDADKNVRDWFVETTKELGCRVTVDSMGNTFAVRPGVQDGAPTYAGSHLDTQPTGGRYDGILGVLSGVEMLRVFKENKIETRYPVGVINWTNEEGARFPKSMVASGVWAGSIPLEDAHNLQEVGDGGRTMREELKRIGYLGETPASYKSIPIGAHFEIHIEQGPILEAERLKIGAVSGVQAYKWHNVSVYGRDCHTGSTPLYARRDALLLACKLIQQSSEAAHQSQNGLASTGILKTFPGSINTVPGRVNFTLDVRAPTDEEQDELEKAIDTRWRNVVDEVNSQYQGNPLVYEDTVTFASKAVKFNSDCINCVRESAKSNFGNSYRDMPSGAGHDSVFASKHAPTAMIFVPCKNGVSHNPEEYCAPEDCANGAQVLMDSILRYDASRS